MKKRRHLRINKMRVCFLTTSYPLYPGDYSGIFIFELAKSLLSQDVEVEVVAPHDNGWKTHEVISGITVYRFRYFFPQSLELLAYHGGIIPRLKKSVVAKLQLPIFLISFLFRGLKVIKNCDIIHVHWIHNGIIALLCNIILKKPLVLTIHGPDINYLPKKGLILNIAKYVLKKVDRIITVSESIRQKAISLGVIGDKIVCIPNGVPDQDIFLNLPGKKSIDYSILFVGRLIPQKNLPFLLEAIAHLKDKLPKIKLTIIGEGPLKKELQNYIKRLTITNHISFEGSQPRHKVYTYFNKADLFVLPSTTEGFPIVILEALAAGKPIISTKVEGVPEIITHEENGIMVEFNDIKGLANAIYRVFNDHDLRGRLSQNSRVTIKEKYTWQNIAQRTKDIYQQLV